MANAAKKIKAVETPVVEDKKPIAKPVEASVAAKKPAPKDGTNAKLWRDLYARSGKVYLTAGKTRLKISKYQLWEMIEGQPDAKADLEILNPVKDGDFELGVVK